MSEQPTELDDMAPNHPPITTPFLSTLNSAATQNANDDPNYYVQDPKSLISTSTIDSFATGTGSAIYQSLAPLLESTAQELILVTCFWARSSTLDTLNTILRKLSDKATYRGGDRIRVRLCFSSLSLFQKLFHTQSTDGQPYPQSVWMKKLGLPSPRDLGGLDIQIKSIFLLPFSVMHPKFMIIDRQKVILPSCNISWEEWFEGAIVMSGIVVNQFLRFYEEFWERSELPPLKDQSNRPSETTVGDAQGQSQDSGHAHLQLTFGSDRGQAAAKDIPTVFLPSPHRRDPAFKPFAPSERVIAPPTPLNIFILTLFAKANKSIRIQTPNVTSPPVLSALLKALARGIDVRILTSEKLMVLEQLVTAGTTTAKSANSAVATDEEAAIASPRPGRLYISYFRPLHGPKARGSEEGQPQQSHLKMTIVDGEVLVLGSGNLDRASWFTSQELGVAFFDRTLAERVGNIVDEAMDGRERNVFNGRGGAFFKLDNYILRRFLYDTDVGLDWWGFRFVKKLTLTLTIILYSPPTSLDELSHSAAQQPQDQAMDLMFLLSPTRSVRALGGRKYNEYAIWQDHMHSLEIFNLHLLAKGDRKRTDWELDGKLDSFLGMVKETEIILRAKTGRVKVSTQCSSSGQGGKSVWEEHQEEGSKTCWTAEKLAAVFWATIKTP